MPRNFQGFYVENNCLVRATVADESAAKIWDEGDPMNSFQIWNISDDRAAISIHDLHFRVVRDVETARGSIECDVVPVFLATGRSAELVFLQQVVTALRGICEGKTAEQQDGSAHSEVM